jgi:hypothetical protein
VEKLDPSVLAPSLSIERQLLEHGARRRGRGTCGAIANAAAAVIAGQAKVVMVYKVIAQPPHARFGAGVGSRRSRPIRRATSTAPTA